METVGMLTHFSVKEMFDNLVNLIVHITMTMQQLSKCFYTIINFTFFILNAPKFTAILNVLLSSLRVFFKKRRDLLRATISNKTLKTSNVKTLKKKQATL